MRFSRLTRRTQIEKGQLDIAPLIDVVFLLLIFFLNEKPITLEQLVATLKQAAQENKSLLLKADTNASLGRVVEIWDLCRDRKSTRLNSSHSQISYAVFCLKKKKIT